MAYDQRLAQRIREALAEHPELIEKKMFGGIAFLLNGNMACGINRDNLIVRVGPAAYAEALSAPHASEFDLTGRPMSGWVQVAPAGYESDEELTAWLEQGLSFAASLPAK